MRFRIGLVALAVALVALPGVVQAQFFFDNFDSYAAGSFISGQGGWETWGGDPGANTQVVNNFSYSAPNSLGLSGAADIVHQFAGVNSGTWYAKVQTYVPSSQTGDLYFIALNRYDGSCAAAGACDWSVQVRMTATDGLVANEGGSSNVGSATLPLLTNQWAEIVVEANITGNTYSVYYNGTFMETLPWTVTGDLNLACFDLFSNASTESYMDDVWLDTTIPVELQSFDAE
jgi:hypothetical protein